MRRISVAMAHMQRAWLVLMVMVVLSSCVATQTAPAPKSPSLAACCANAERQPRWLIDLARPVAPQLGVTIGHMTWRKGWIYRQPEARALIRGKLRPLDILLVSSKGRMSGHTIPGLFGHAVIYLGGERELRAAGVWNSAAVAPYAASISKGQYFLEADYEGVHLSGEARVLNTDRALVLRPHVSSPGRRRQILQDYFGKIGLPFDFRFDLDTPDCVFCTELINQVQPELRLPVSRLYGTRLIFPEMLAKAALEGMSPLRVVVYVKADAKGWTAPATAFLRADIAAAWQVRH